MLFSLPSRWPLVPIDIAAFYLDRRPEDVARQSDSFWTWDIASAGAQKRQLRIWRDSLLACKNRAVGRHLLTQLEQVIDSFLPARGLRGSELQDLFYCTAHHIRTLHEAGRLAVEQARRTPHGPNSTNIYTRESVKDFLTRSCLMAAPAAAVGLHPDSRNLTFLSAAVFAYH